MSSVLGSRMETGGSTRAAARPVTLLATKTPLRMRVLAYFLMRPVHACLWRPSRVPPPLPNSQNENSGRDREFIPIRRTGHTLGRITSW